MKILIDDTLKWVYEVDTKLSYQEYNEELEAFDDILKLLDKFTVHYKKNLLRSKFVLEIEIQKCVLDECDMNTLFYTVLSNFDHNLVYSPLGGEGCDFALRVTSK